MKELSDPTKLSALISFFLSLFELGGKLWGFGSKVWRGFANEGMYEVLENDQVLELLDKSGKKAAYTKRKVVRYLQDNIIAYPDYGWGDGKFMKNYRASPGIPVDQYKLGYKTFTLLSLREAKNKGDIDEFHIQWDILDGFLKSDGFWETDISNRTKQISVTIIFPKDRPPLKLSLFEANTNMTQNLSDDCKKKLSDGRWQVVWTKEKPRLFEHYILRWDW